MVSANAGGRVAWITPTYKNSRPLWRWAENTVAPLKRFGVDVSRAERVITFPNGGFVGVYSADDGGHAIRGESFHLVILDEAARIGEDAWQDAINPTLADFDGDAILISTPKARNWFYNEWVRAKELGGAWQAPTNANPHPNIQKAFALARERMPERTFKQEWLAEFIEGSGAVFRNVRAVCVLDKPDVPENHGIHSFVMGVDWGKQNDFTRIGIACRECSRMVDWDGFNRIEYHFQRERLKLMYNRWNPETVLAERNSIGDPNIEELARDGLPIVGFDTTATTKPPLIEALALAIERGEFMLPREDADELEAYEAKVNPVTNRTTYSAPDGMHDDRVMRAALTWRAMTQATNELTIGANPLAGYRG